MSAATPLQILQYGHISIAIRNAMERLQITPAELNERMGKNRSNGMIYNILTCKCAPTVNTRQKLTAVLGIDEHDLLPKTIDSAVEGQLPTVLQDTQIRINRWPVYVPPTEQSEPDEMFSFVTNNDGLARIQLDVTLPLAEASVVFRTLMDMKVIKGE